MTPESIALAIINDGSTYAERKALTLAYTRRNHPAAYVIRQLRRMVDAEMRKPVYDGERLSNEAASEAASKVHDYMLGHYAESNNGKDWQ